MASYSYTEGYKGGSDGAGGNNGSLNNGQGSTTREFGEPSGMLYAGGGGGLSRAYDFSPSPGAGGDGGGGRGGGVRNGTMTITPEDGKPNTGGGAGGGGAKGGSGIVIIRNAR